MNPGPGLFPQGLAAFLKTYRNVIVSIFYEDGVKLSKLDELGWAVKRATSTP